MLVATATGTIVDDDTAGSVGIADASIVEGDRGTSLVTLTLTRSGGNAAFSVNYSTSDGGGAGSSPANAGADYTLAAGTVAFAAGQNTATIQVVVAGDYAVEPDEQFSVTLSNPTNGATVAGAVAHVAIINDDQAFGITNPSAAEGNSGASAIDFTLTRNGGSGSAQTIFVQPVANGTATAGADFDASPITVTFAANQTTAHFLVPVTSDREAEDDETFGVQIFGDAAHAVLLATATGTILNDDVAGLVSVGGISVTEGDSGTQIVTLTVSRSVGDASFAVNYATSDGHAAGFAPAIAGADYVATFGTLYFAAGQSSATISVSVIGDTVAEDNEQFSVTLSGATGGAMFAGATAYVTIQDNDGVAARFAGARAPTTGTVITHILASPTDTVSAPVGGGYDAVYSDASFTLAGGAEVELVATRSETSTNPVNLTGNEFSQAIIGNAGDNIINGGGGADTLYGLGGNDTFLVRGPGDIVIETNGDGFDIVYSTVSYNLGENEIEVLSTVTQSDTTPINLIGNFVSQYVVGNYGDNLLNGGSGADTLIGLRGNDLYAVGDSRIIIIEADGEGNDTVVTSVDYALGAGVSVEVLAAQSRGDTSALQLRGNEFAQTIAGNDGANTIDGGLGSDVLIGGGGADRFAFTTALGGGNIDTIADFEVGIDRIALASTIFGGSFTAANFLNGATATTADQHILYNQATGQIFFDEDGSGSAAAILFAIVTPGTALTVGSFETIPPVATVG